MGRCKLPEKYVIKFMHLALEIPYFLCPGEDAPGTLYWLWAKRPCSAPQQIYFISSFHIHILPKKYLSGK
jgi:hypothetical protein